MSKEITINGKSYPIEIDGMGVAHVQGMLVDDFLEQLDYADHTWLARYGLKLAQTDPEYFDDINERIETPADVKSLMDEFKPTPGEPKVSE